MNHCVCLNGAIHSQEEFARVAMVEREEEMHNINQKVYKVNEIYKVRPSATYDVLV